MQNVNNSFQIVKFFTFDLNILKSYAKFLITLVLLMTAFFCLLTGNSASAETHNEGSNKTVRFSAITLYHPITMYQKYQPLMSYLTENTPYRFELKLSQEYCDIIDFLEEGSVDVALLGGVTYSLAKTKCNIVPILAPLSAEGKPYYRSALIARASNNSIRKLSDIKGKSLALASKLSTSGNLVPLYHLYTNGIRLEDLEKHKHFRYHDSVAREVLRGNYDVGAVIYSVADRFKDRGLKIIAVFGPIPALPIIARCDVQPELIESIKKALLPLDYANPEHRKIMEKWDEEFRYGFVETNDSSYRSTTEMIEYLNSEGVKIP